MTCIVCMDEGGSIENKKRYYGCDCNECVFHNDCFVSYANTHRKCPICRKEKVGCLICMDIDGILYNKNEYYNCECNCLFHSKCFKDYTRRNNKCPVCNKVSQSKYKSEFIFYKGLIILHSLFFAVVWAYSDLIISVLCALDLLHNIYELILSKRTQRFNIFVLNNHMSRYCWLFLSCYRIVSLVFIFVDTNISSSVNIHFIVYYIFYSLVYLILDVILIVIDYFSEE